MVDRHISEQEIRDAGSKAEVIENYPEDKYSPSGLLLGFTAAGRPLHQLVPDTRPAKTVPLDVFAVP